MKKEKQIVFMDGFDSVRDVKTQNVEIFSTILPTDLQKLTGRNSIPERVIENVIISYNSGGNEVVDNYLLYEDDITQDEREIIVESLYIFENS